jgi:hypothetical protein
MKFFHWKEQSLAKCETNLYNATIKCSSVIILKGTKYKQPKKITIQENAETNFNKGTIHEKE